MANRTNIMIGLLILLVIVLSAVLLYVLVVAPALTGYAIQRQNEGAQFALLSVMQRAASCQTVPLTYNNQTINLIALECVQQPQQPAG